MSSAQYESSNIPKLLVIAVFVQWLTVTDFLVLSLITNKIVFLIIFNNVQQSLSITSIVMFAIKRYVLFNNEQKYDILNRLIN